jgi:hypothetical protein
MKSIYNVIGILIVCFLHVNLPQFDWLLYLGLAWLLLAVATKRTNAFFVSAFGCSVVPARECDNCNTDEKNKIVHVAFVKKGTTIDVSTAVGFTSAILSAEIACNAYVIRNVSGAYDGGSFTEGKGAGKQVSRITGGKHVVTFTDFDYVANVAFWNGFKKAASGFDIYFFTDTYGWKTANSFLSVFPKGTISDNIEEFIEATIECKWSSQDLPLNYKANVDDLATCPALFDPTSLHFTNISGSTATIIPGSGGSADEIDLVSGSTNLHASLTAGVSMDALLIVNGQLPSGVIASISGTTIRLNGIATVPGTFVATIRAQSPCGVGADVTVKFVVS